MTDPSAMPDDVRALIQRRAEAREARDWARADAIRDDLAARGWEVQDTTAGSTARPILVSPADAAAAGGRLDEPAAVPVSIQVVAEDHADDLARLMRGFAAHPPPVTEWELLIVANAPSFDLGQVLGSIDLPVEPAIVHSDERLGWADARTLGMRQSRAEITLLLDTSLEPVGDVVSPLLAAFGDETVGLAGGWGVRSDDGRQFEEAPPGEVDAIEAYCLAVRRDALRAVGGFDRRFRFYRNADLDFSFAVRDAGWRAVRTHDLPFVRHEHRGYASLPDEERERLSRRNFYRFLEHWGDRPDLLLDHQQGREATEQRR